MENNTFTSFLEKNKKDAIADLRAIHKLRYIDKYRKFSKMWFAGVASNFGLALASSVASFAGTAIPNWLFGLVLAAGSSVAIGGMVGEIYYNHKVSKEAERDFAMMTNISSFFDGIVGDGVNIGMSNSIIPGMIIITEMGMDMDEEDRIIDVEDFSVVDSLALDTGDEKQPARDMFDIQATNLEEYIKAFEYPGYEDDLDQLFGLMQGYAFEKDDPEYALVYYDALQELERLALQKGSQCEEKGMARNRRNKNNG